MQRTEEALSRLGAIAADVLPGGVPFTAWPHPSSNALALAISFKDGVHYESADQWGFAHFLEHLHFKRTRNHPDFLSLVSSIEEVGGKLSAYSTRESITYWVLLPCWHIDRAVRILGEILTQTTFRPDDVDKEKKLIHEEIIREKANPRFYNKLFVEEVLLSPRGLCRHPLGSRRSIADVQPAAMEQYKSRSYSLSNMYVAAAGSMERLGVRKALEALLGAFPQGERRVPCERLEGFAVHEEKKFILTYAGARQTNMSLGWLLPVPDRRERYVWQMMNTLLGVGYSSYLFQRLREERALTYLTQTSLRFYETAGTWRLDLDCFEENIPAAFEEIRKVLEMLRERPGPAEHLERARNMYWGGLLLALEEGLERVKWLSHTITSRDASCDLAEIADFIASVTPDDLMRLAGEHLRLEDAVVCLAGDPDRIMQHLGEDYTVLDQF